MNDEKVREADAELSEITDGLKNCRMLLGMFQNVIRNHHLLNQPAPADVMRKQAKRAS